MFGLWAPEFLIFDPKIRFYVKCPPRNRVERSGIRNPRPKMRKIIEYDFFKYEVWVKNTDSCS